MIKNPLAMQETWKRHGFDPRLGKIPWRRKWQHTPVFLPGKSNGQRSLVGYSPWGHNRVGYNFATKQQHIFFLRLIFFFYFTAKRNIYFFS